MLVHKLCTDDAPCMCMLFTAFKQKNPLGNPFRCSGDRAGHNVFFLIVCVCVGHGVL